MAEKAVPQKNLTFAENMITDPKEKESGTEDKH